MKLQINKFVEVVYEPNDIVELRLFGDGLKVIRQWHRAADLPSLADQLLGFNQQGYHIYAGANPRKQYGSSGDKNVKLARCLFADFDKIEPGDGCGLSEFVLGRVEDAEVPNPSMVLSSGNGIHCYWRLSEPLYVLNKWKELQGRLNKTLGSDPAIKNPERIMRVPGFLNVKSNPGKDCFVIYGA